MKLQASETVLLLYIWYSFTSLVLLLFPVVFQLLLTLKELPLSAAFV